MISVAQLTNDQLNSIIAIREQIEKLQSQIDSIADGGDTSILAVPTQRRRRISRAGRARISTAAKARWAKARGTTATPSAAKKQDKRSSPAVRAKLAEAARARWAKAKAEGKQTL